MSKKNTSIPKNHQSDPRKWYTNIVKLFTELFNDRGITTTLQILFSPAFYCEKLVGCKVTYEQKKSKDEYEKDFYRALDGQFSFNGNIKTLVGLNGKISDTLTIKIITNNESVLNIDENRLNDLLVSRQNPIVKKCDQAPPYNNKMVLNQYQNHKDFYIRYLAVILEAMQEHQLITDMEQFIANIDSMLPARPNVYSDNEYENFAYHLYELILREADSKSFLMNKNKSTALSRLTNGSDPKIKEDMYNYISVIEYYPVNTAERLGALEMLAQKDNLYALQELYFLYQNDTVLYNSSGTSQFVLKKDTGKTESFYKRLTEKNPDFLAAVFRHDKEEVKKNFISAELEYYKLQYDNIPQDKLNAAPTHENIRAMIKTLKEIHDNPSIPFNIDLVWFIHKLLTKHSHIRELDSLKSDIDNILLKNPWIEPLMDSENEMKNLEFEDIIFEFYQLGFNENVLIDVCREWAKDDTDKLDKCLTSAIQKATDFFQLSLSEKNDKLSKKFLWYQMQWAQVSSFLKKAIQEMQT